MAYTHAERQKRYRLRQKGLLPPVPVAMSATERNRKYYYGVDRVTFDTMIRKQKYKCAICGCAIDHSSHVDHDHITKCVRGILCGHCNKMLGYARDSIDILRKAITYMDR